MLLAAAGSVAADLQIDRGHSAVTGRALATSLGLPAATRACVVIVDGLGLHNLRARSAQAPVLTDAKTLALRTGLPSTTATNMTLLGTGLESGQTGMLGYTVRNPGNGRLLNLISWAAGPDPLSWQQQPTIFERFAQQGLVSVSIGPWAFESSPLTQAALRGAEYESAESLPDRVNRTLQVLQEPDVTLTTMYWGEVDHTGHEFGWSGQRWAAELAALDAELGRLQAGAPAGTLLLVTADHGMVDIPLGASQTFGGPARFDVATDPRLAESVTLVAGEPRFVHVYTEPGAAADVARQWRLVLADRADVRTRDEAVRAGWFGPVESRYQPVIGDVVAAMRGDVCVLDSRTQTEGSLRLIGMHGSRSPAETTVPLVLLAH